MSSYLLTSYMYKVTISSPWLEKIVRKVTNLLIALLRLQKKHKVEGKFPFWT